jgi:MFS family permease
VGLDPEVTAPNRPLAAVFTATFFVRFAFGITIAVFASYVAGHSSGFSQSDVGRAGLVSALAPVGEFATVLLSGAAADRWGRFPVLFAGMAGAAAMFAVVADTRALLALALANLLFGVASGAILAASLAVVSDLSGAGERGLEMGRFDAMNLSGWIAGFAFGFGAWAALPNRSLGEVFLAGAAALLVGLFAAILLLRGGALRASARGFSLAGVLRSAFRRSVLVVTLPWLVIYSLIGAALYFLGPAATTVGISPTELALAIGGAGALLVLTQPFFGRLADRYGRTRLMTLGAVGFGLVMLFASLLFVDGPRWPLLAGMGGSILLALAYGPAALAALSDLAAAESRATTMAVYSLTISLGMLVGLLASTSLYAQFGNLGIFAFFGGIAAVLGLLTALRWLEERRATIPAR